MKVNKGAFTMKRKKRELLLLTLMKIASMISFASSGGDLLTPAVMICRGSLVIISKSFGFVEFPILTPIITTSWPSRSVTAVFTASTLSTDWLSIITTRKRLASGRTFCDRYTLLASSRAETRLTGPRCFSSLATIRIKDALSGSLLLKIIGVVTTEPKTITL